MGEMEADRKVRFSDAVNTVTCAYEEEPIMSDIGIVDCVGHRLYEQGRKTKADIEKQEKLRHDKELKEAKEKARPWVTDQETRCESFTAFHELQVKWKIHRDQNIASKKDEQKKERLAHEKVKWKMDDTSTDIISRKVKKGNYAGPQKGWKAGFSKYIKSKNAEKPPPEDFEPTINTASKQLVRGGSAHERLYALAAEKEESLMMLRAWENDKMMIDSETGAPRFHPKTLSSSKADVHYENSRLRNSQGYDGQSVASSQFSKRRSFDELMEHLHSKSPDHRPPAAAQEPPCSFTPETNPTSALILERAGPRPPLYQPVSSLLSWRERSASPQPPRYSSKTPEQKHKLKQSHNAFLARQLRDELEKENKKQDLVEELDSKELSGCTFHPQISKRSEEIFRESKYSKIGKDVKFKKKLPQRRCRSEEKRPEPESSTAAFIRKLEEDQARDREAGNRARRARSASPNKPPPTPPSHPFTPDLEAKQDTDIKKRDPSPIETPQPSPSSFLNTLQSELKNVIEGWKDFDL